MMRWYAIVDGAADPRLYDLIVTTKDHACLYAGDYAPETKKALPYIVAMQNKERFSQIWSSNEAGNFWGILCQSAHGLLQLRRHFRHFTTARLPLGEVVLFRFWDPRIFVPFVEKGTSDEIAPFFKGVETFVADLGKEGRKRYSWGNELQTMAL